MQQKEASSNLKYLISTFIKCIYVSVTVVILLLTLDRNFLLSLFNFSSGYWESLFM